MAAKLAHFGLQVTVKVTIAVSSIDILVTIAAAALRVSLGAQSVNRGHISEIFFNVYRGALFSNFILFLYLFIYKGIFVIVLLFGCPNGRRLVC